LNQNGSEEYWLAFAHAPRPVNHLLNYFGSPRDVFEAGYREWRTLGIKRDLLNYLQNPNWAAVEKDMQWLAQPGNYLLTLYHPDYPRLLREIYDPPLLLFVQGNCAILSNLQIAIVGTRNGSSEGIRNAKIFAKALSYQGFTITSGMATYGIEGASLWGALAGTGKIIAVSAQGLDKVSSIQHNDLVDKIVERGTLVSEFPPGTPVRRENFLSRSRIVSGLSLGTLIIEAPKRSKALHTVRFALEQGREVFAMPGSIYNPLVEGCHQLIKEGAKLVETIDDILEELQIYLILDDPVFCK